MKLTVSRPKAGLAASRLPFRLHLSRLTLAVGAAVVVALAVGIAFLAGAFGSVDRAAMARDRVNTYWYDVGHGKWKTAYYMLTPGNRQHNTLADFVTSFQKLLEQTNGIYERTGKIEINGDTAVAAVSLRAPASPGAPFNRYQHLYWDGSNWYFTDNAGGLSSTK